MSVQVLVCNLSVSYQVFSLAISSFDKQMLTIHTDTRRMNVALTRAKSSLFILGNAPTLERSDGTWRQIVEDARSSSSLVDVTIISFYYYLFSCNGRLTLTTLQERHHQRQLLHHPRKNHEQLPHHNKH